MYNSVEFIKSSYSITQLPSNNNIEEFAFVGRSNVGKSSLINVLTDRKNICKVSSKPGKTRLINHFFIDNKFYLVDLPGYGYAKVSKKERDNFFKLINDYCTKRKKLKTLYIIVDGSIPIQKIDLDFIDFVFSKNVDFSIVFNKVDRIKKSKRKTLLNKMAEKYYSNINIKKDIDFFFFSATKKIGIEELKADINKKTSFK